MRPVQIPLIDGIALLTGMIDHLNWMILVFCQLFCSVVDIRLLYSSSFNLYNFSLGGLLKSKIRARWKGLFNKMWVQSSMITCEEYFSTSIYVFWSKFAKIIWNKNEQLSFYFYFSRDKITVPKNVLFSFIQGQKSKSLIRDWNLKYILYKWELNSYLHLWNGLFNNQYVSQIIMITCEQYFQVTTFFVLSKFAKITLNKNGQLSFIFLNIFLFFNR